MGETPPPQRIEINFGPGVDEQLARALRGLLRLGEPIAPPAPEPAAETHALTPYDLGLAPWAFHSPSHGGDVMAYVDDRNQLRHVPSTRTAEVPPTWQRVWLQPRS